MLPIFDGLEDDDILEDKRPGWPGSTTLFGFIHCTDSESIISSLDTHVNTAGRVILGVSKNCAFPFNLGTYADLFRETTHLTHIVPPSHREAPFLGFLELPGKGFLTSVGWLFGSDSIRKKFGEETNMFMFGCSGRRYLKMCGLSVPLRKKSIMIFPFESKLAVIEKNLNGFTTIQTSWGHTSMVGVQMIPCCLYIITYDQWIQE